MVEPVSWSSGTQILRPRARILRTFGDELGSSETAAVIELVKNAYDADATRVLVRFYGPLEIGQGRIEVMDNGHGMSLETIQTTWMEPATLFRKRQQRSAQYGRRVLGEKGIGRFAASRLANTLEVVTRRAGEDRETRVLFDWSQFDDEHKYLDQVKVLWEESEPAEICPGSTVLWREDQTPESSELTHGTILRMEGLRAIWGESQLETLRTGLSRLVSPFFKQDQLPGQDVFQIYLELPEQFASLSGIIEPPETLKSPHYTITGHVDDTGHYTFTLRLPGQDHQEHGTGQFSLPDRHTPTCGPFSIELRVWDRDSLGGLAHERGATITDIRRDLDAAAGINIYRDGFRVLPYGEPRNDWLRLDLRRVQNPTMRLSNNQIMGYVFISADQNPQLRDQSNREGLIEGPALDDLRELVKMALAELEKRRYTIRRQSNTGKQTAPAGGLFTDLDLTDISDLIKKRYPDNARLLDLVEERERELEMRIKVVQEVLACCLPLTEQVEYQQWRDGLPTPSNAHIRQLQELLRNNRQGNQSERFFFLPGALSLPDLVADFQQLVTLRREHINGLERLASLDSPFAEALLARLARYFGRLGTLDLDVAVLLQRLQAVTGARTT